MRHEPQTGIWKDADSPAGHGFYAPIDLSNLPDCPVCKHGTPRFMGDGKPWVCIDCGAKLSLEQIKRP